MRTQFATVALLALGVALMANPLYLPLPLGEPDPAYTHSVQPVTDESPIGPDSPVADDDDLDPEDLDANDSDALVAYADLDPAARAAFDRARESG
ncbi:MAG: hypothetical protein ACOC06_02600, partial [Halorubrum sp.]